MIQHRPLEQRPLPDLPTVQRITGTFNAKNAGGTSAYSNVFSFTTVPATSGVPALTAPSDGATGIAIAPTLTWGTVTGAATYRVQLSTISTFATTVVDDSTLTVGTKAITGLANSTVYYWRANAKNSGGTSAWAVAYSFTTIVAAPATAPSLTMPANAAIGISITPTLTWGHGIRSSNISRTGFHDKYFCNNRCRRFNAHSWIKGNYNSSDQ